MSTLALVSAALGAAKAGLSLLEEREKNYPKKQAAKLKQRLDDLEREWYKEYNRDLETRSDAELDRLDRELCVLLGDFAASVGLENLPH